MKIAIIGGGNMGVTYARAFVRSNIVPTAHLLIIEKHDEKRVVLKQEGIALLADDITAQIAEYDIIIVAVKPQDFITMSTQLKDFLKPNQLVLSIMAGITIATIANHLGGHQKIARAMPNTPAQLGFGISAFAIAPGAGQESISIIDTLLETTGKSIFMNDESLIDAVTAMSGSGPAYFYYFIKHMIEAGKQLGLEEHVSSLLAKQTMLGAFQMMVNSKDSLDHMISMVASKGGTTEAALNTFEQLGVGHGIQDAIKAAEKRAKELSKG
jgi:pyrroline-5-carboxylate reductase